MIKLNVYFVQSCSRFNSNYYNRNNFQYIAKYSIKIKVIDGNNHNFIYFKICVKIKIKLINKSCNCLLYDVPPNSYYLKVIPLGMSGMRLEAILNISQIFRQ